MDADDTKCRPDAEEGSRPTKSEAGGWMSEARRADAERTIHRLHSAASEAASQSAKCRYQNAKCPTGRHSARSYGGEATRSEESRPFGKLGQALPRRQTRFLVAPLLGMTSSRKRRSCTFVAQRIGGYRTDSDLHLSPCAQWSLWLIRSRFPGSSHSLD